MNQNVCFYKVATGLNSKISNELSAIEKLRWREISVTLPEAARQEITLDLKSLFAVGGTPALNILSQVAGELEMVRHELKLAQQYDETEPADDCWDIDPEERDLLEYL